jgi:hypothetical protein
MVSMCCTTEIHHFTSLIGYAASAPPVTMPNPIDTSIVSIAAQAARNAGFAGCIVSDRTMYPSDSTVVSAIATMIGDITGSWHG